MMDEYITRNNAISAVCFGCNQQFSDEPCEPSECSIRQSIMALPTADVVPKSEVDRLTVELEAMRTAANSYKMHYENLAREIFAEIWKCMEHDYISSIDVFSGALGLRIAELKKKYIGESDVKRDTV